MDSETDDGKNVELRIHIAYFAEHAIYTDNRYKKR